MPMLKMQEITHNKDVQSNSMKSPKSSQSYIVTLSMSLCTVES